MSAKKSSSHREKLWHWRMFTDSSHLARSAFLSGIGNTRRRLHITSEGLGCSESLTGNLLTLFLASEEEKKVHFGGCW